MPRYGDWLVPDLKRPIETIPTRFAVSDESDIPVPAACFIGELYPIRLSAKTPDTYAWLGWTRGHTEPIWGPSPSGDL